MEICSTLTLTPVLEQSSVGGDRRPLEEFKGASEVFLRRLRIAKAV